jgi:uncharacterized phage infection (PIP) family protein YhgE
MRRVYVFDVTNPELAGAKEVTIAHEMLHAAYERLNMFERSKIDKLLEDEYYTVQRDAKVQRLMEYYKKAEPAALTNELHSILGTVVADLSPELEQYYARYFNDRQHIVQVNNDYYAVFSEVNAKSKDLADRISVLNDQILKDKDVYQNTMEQLKAEIDAYKARNYTSVRQSQLDARALNARVGQLESSRQAINAKVEQLNALIEEQNKLNIKATELNNSINGIDNSEVSL